MQEKEEEEEEANSIPPFIKEREKNNRLTPKPMSHAVNTSFSSASVKGSPLVVDADTLTIMIVDAGSNAPRPASEFSMSFLISRTVRR